MTLPAKGHRGRRGGLATLRLERGHGGRGGLAALRLEPLGRRGLGRVTLAKRPLFCVVSSSLACWASSAASAAAAASRRWASSRSVVVA